jgi:hypothetical protein
MYVGILDMAMVIEAMGLRSADASRPSDVVALDFSAGGRHIGVDAVVTTVYRNTVIRRVAFIPGYDAKQTIDRKILADGTSAEHIASIICWPARSDPLCNQRWWTPRRPCPRPPKALAAITLEKGRRPPFAYRAHAASAPKLASL